MSAPVHYFNVDRNYLEAGDVAVCGFVARSGGPVAVNGLCPDCVALLNLSPEDAS